MAVDFSKEVDYVSRLAHLELAHDEKELMARQLSDILETAGRVQELDTSRIEPAAYGQSGMVQLREDEVKESLPPQAVFQNAPSREGNFFKVPRITLSAAENEEV